LYDLLREKIDKESEEVVETRDEKITEVNVGEYRFLDYERAGKKTGTTILADQVHPTFTRSFQQSLSFERYKDPPVNWKDSVRFLSTIHSLQELGDYWRLLWELSAACPVAYLSATAVPRKLIANEQRKLESYDFRLLVDGIQLFKPIYLRSNRYGYTTKVIEPEQKLVYGRNLRFHGYIAVQE